MEVWAGLREPRRLMRNPGAGKSRGKLLPPLDLKGQGKQTRNPLRTGAMEGRLAP